MVVTHLPSKLSVRCETERSQHANRASALALLRARLWERQSSQRKALEDHVRRQQIGSGMRGDKRRTVAQQRGTVIDHLTGRHWRYEDYLKGNW